jgi:methionyl-tRNA formyltransferase
VHDLSLWQTTSLRGEDALSRLQAIGAEVMALAAFAALVPTEVLHLAPCGILNVHPSVLPRWRGAAPIQSALLAGDDFTGVSVMRLVAALDAGPILLQQALPIAPEDDYLSLEPRLAALGAALLIRALETAPMAFEQDASQATYSRRLERQDGRIEWNQTATAIWRQVRALRGWPQAFTTFDGRTLKVLRATPAVEDGASGADRANAGPTVGEQPWPPGSVRVEGGRPLVATGGGWLRLDEVQLEGRRPISGAEFVRGYPRIEDTNLA